MKNTTGSPAKGQDRKHRPEAEDHPTLPARGKPRNSRKETEAERLRRIALERKAKPITVSIG